MRYSGRPNPGRTIDLYYCISLQIEKQVIIRVGKLAIVSWWNQVYSNRSLMNGATQRRRAEKRQTIASAKEVDQRNKPSERFEQTIDLRCSIGSRYKPGINLKSAVSSTTRRCRN